MRLIFLVVKYLQQSPHLGSHRDCHRDCQRDCQRRLAGRPSEDPRKKRDHPDRGDHLRDSGCQLEPKDIQRGSGWRDGGVRISFDSARNDLLWVTGFLHGHKKPVSARGGNRFLGSDLFQRSFSGSGNCFPERACFRDPPYAGVGVLNPLLPRPKGDKDAEGMKKRIPSSKANS